MVIHGVHMYRRHSPHGELERFVNDFPSLFFWRQRHRHPFTPQSNEFLPMCKIILHFSLDGERKKAIQGKPVWA
jgi:hypothetical protein